MYKPPVHYRRGLFCVLACALTRACGQDARSPRCDSDWHTARHRAPECAGHPHALPPTARVIPMPQQSLPLLSAPPAFVATHSRGGLPAQVYARAARKKARQANLAGFRGKQRRCAEPDQSFCDDIKLS